MIDLTPLTVWLSGLGPYGPLLAMAALWLVPKLLDQLKKKFPSIPVPVKPVDPAVPAPAPAPAPAPSGRPVLDAMLNTLMTLLAVRYPGRDPQEVLHEQLGHAIVRASLPRSSAAPADQTKPAA